MPDPHADLLPDSRAQITRGSKWSAAWGCMAIPIFCANCGASGGFVPEENCDFACYLCNRCVREHPLPLGLHVMPDEAFFAQVAADHGLTVPELAAAVAVAAGNAPAGSAVPPLSPAVTLSLLRSPLSR